MRHDRRSRGLLQERFQQQRQLLRVRALGAFAQAGGAEFRHEEFQRTALLQHGGERGERIFNRLRMPTVLREIRHGAADLGERDTARRLRHGRPGRCVLVIREGRVRGHHA